MPPPSTLPAVRATIARAQKPLSRAELMRRTGLDERTIVRHVRTLLADNEAHIAAWDPAPVDARGRKPTARLALGPGDDAPRPPRQTTAAKMQRYRDRQRKTGDWEDVLSRNRGLYHARRPPRRDSMIAALFGPAPSP